MRYSIAAIALGVALMVFAKSGIVLPSNDTLMLSVAIVIAGALAGGDE